MRLLYVEDEPTDAELVALYIRSTDHELILARNTNEARQALAQTPDLILLDVVLNNRREGYDFARELRGQGYDSPVIAVTALSTPHDKEACWEAGFTDILSKPFTITDLEGVILQYTA